VTKKISFPHYTKRETENGSEATTFASLSREWETHSKPE
jgi:hypothetical protein